MLDVVIVEAFGDILAAVLSSAFDDLFRNGLIDQRMSKLRRTFLRERRLLGTDMYSCFTVKVKLHLLTDLIYPVVVAFQQLHAERFTVSFIDFQHVVTEDFAEYFRADRRIISRVSEGSLA